MSPHLAQFGLTGAFDDGIVVGSGRLDGQVVVVAAQEGQLLGGAFGEVHGAKLVGLLRTARDGAGRGVPRAVLLLLDTGGVRLQEASAGELAISEIIRAILEVAAPASWPWSAVGPEPSAAGTGLHARDRGKTHWRFWSPHCVFRARGQDGDSQTDGWGLIAAIRS
jgi:malonate decarboxylase beta subunit